MPPQIKRYSVGAFACASSIIMLTVDRYNVWTSGWPCTYPPSSDLEGKSDAVKFVFLWDNPFKIGKKKRVTSRKIEEKTLKRLQRLKRWKRLKGKKERCGFVWSRRQFIEKL